MSAVWQALEALHDHMTAVGTAYMFTGQTAAAIQGAAVPLDQLQIQVQWDQVQDVYEHLSHQQLVVEPVVRQPGQLVFRVQTPQGLPAEVCGPLNTGRRHSAQWT
jgi:3-hydroxymyristoyl/3-hydroxydecanoyl-(acyl carrier protein) dehydratase